MWYLFASLLKVQDTSLMYTFSVYIYGKKLSQLTKQPQLYDHVNKNNIQASLYHVSFE